MVHNQVIPLDSRKFLHVFFMSGAKPFRHKQIYRLPYHLIGRIAEDFFGTFVEQDDLLRFVYRNDSLIRKTHPLYDGRDFLAKGLDGMPMWLIQRIT
jgi:hypothetical protein